MTVRRPIVVDAAGAAHEHVDAEAVGVAHLCGAGGKPTVAITSGLVAGAAVTLDAGSTDMAGEITLTTGLLGLGVGAVVTLTFATPYANRVFANLSGTTANAVGSGTLGTSATGLTITLGLALGLNGTMKWQYSVTGQAGG